ncbi:MAG TPA: hypothetical protein DEQ23_00310 [Chlorobium sp.]|uniref:Phosphate ABC transporter substrate-binding protein, PhoT family n=1 Tax=Chlorobium phaeovibrioides (strain DSM 265 / 1930) TaxID=290318 RepID=A4SEI2_CHLPM|nr:hypothetical protein [Chlorobium sp.]
MEMLCQHLFSLYLIKALNCPSGCRRQAKRMTMHNLLLKPFFISLFLIAALSSCRRGEDPETPISGKLTLIADGAGIHAARIQGEVFSRYYPDAVIQAVPAEGSVQLRRGQAALISRKPQQDSLAVLRIEPVAYDALVVLVGIRNPVSAMTVTEVSSIFQGLRPFAGEALAEQVRLVGRGRQMAALVLRSEYVESALPDEAEGRVKLIPILKQGKGVFPDPEQIMNGSYPLVTTLYYVYYPGDGLAAGFGAWLTDRGQSVFARSGFVPLSELSRTIILN